MKFRGVFAFKSASQVPLDSPGSHATDVGTAFDADDPRSPRDRSESGTDMGWRASRIADQVADEAMAAWSEANADGEVPNTPDQRAVSTGASGKKLSGSGGTRGGVHGGQRRMLRQASSSVSSVEGRRSSAPLLFMPTGLSGGDRPGGKARNASPLQAGVMKLLNIGGDNSNNRDQGPGGDLVAFGGTGDQRSSRHTMLSTMHKQRSLDSMTSQSRSGRMLFSSRAQGTPQEQRERTLKIYAELSQRCLSKRSGPPGQVTLSATELETLRIAYLNQATYSLTSHDKRNDARMQFKSRLEEFRRKHHVAHGQGEDEPEEHGRYVEALMHLTERSGMRGSELEGTLSDGARSVQSGLTGAPSMSSDGDCSVGTLGSSRRTTETILEGSLAVDDASDGGAQLTSAEIAAATSRLRASSRASTQDVFMELHRERQEGTAQQNRKFEGDSGKSAAVNDKRIVEGGDLPSSSFSSPPAPSPPSAPPPPSSSSSSAAATAASPPPPPPPITPEDLKRRDELIDQLDSWDFDVFEVNDLCPSRPLVFVGFALVMHSKFALNHSPASAKPAPPLTTPSSPPTTSIPSSANASANGNAAVLATAQVAQEGIDLGKLRCFLNDVDAGYLQNPYHNNLHGADVAQSVYCIMRSGGMYSMLADWQELGAIVGGLVHDLGHFALTNPFLKSTNHKLALTYYYRSPLESMHLAKVNFKFEGF